MPRITATTRIAIGLTCVTATVLLVAQSVGLVPDRRDDIIHGRLALCEALAIHSSVLATRNEVGRLQSSVEAIVQRNPDILSAAVRRESGRVLVAVGDHQTHWQPLADELSTESRVLVPIQVAGRSWGKVEVAFTPISQEGVLGFLQTGPVRLTAFILSLSYLAYLVYLSRVLRHLDPSKVVPDRVRTALDTLAEGLLLLDNDGRIVLANRAFAESVGKSTSELLGAMASSLPWSVESEEGAADGGHPWREVIRDGQFRTDDRMTLKHDEQVRIFNVNTSPILGDRGERRGVLTSFNDVTRLEASRKELRIKLDALKESRDEIGRQNRELELLATRDPLTSCLNRRSFFRDFEIHWEESQRSERPLCCAMVDVDHFKSVNDRFGHAVGDLVLKRVAEALSRDRKPGEMVCRYGGEEFCLVFPATDLDAACQAAERCREAVAALAFDVPGLTVTASFGVSSSRLTARTPQQLLDEADQCLYGAKRSGRNRVVRVDNMPDVPEESAADASRALSPDPDVSTVIPFPAVTALFSALAYRDGGTAEHSRRVADWCVAAAHGLMPPSDVHVLEIAALLHDIGKIGVPDAILLKPGPLTDEEWKIMGIHDRIGVEILGAAFACEKLSHTVESHHAWYGGNPRDPDLPTGENIPLGARILAIADAYDAMTSDRVYRKGRSPEAAFAELKRFAGRQFDAQLVDRFIACVLARDESRQPEVHNVPRQIAHQISLEIERLANALDAQDLFGISSLAGRLKQTAASASLTSIAKLAEQIEASATDESDLLPLVKLTSDLLDLCRSTQRAYLRGDASSSLPPKRADARPSPVAVESHA